MEQTSKLQVVMLMGLQGAGKTTFFHRHFGLEYAHISMDLLRNNRHPSRRQLHLLREALEAGQSAVVDNTNSTVGEREPLIALAREFGTRVVGYYFPPDISGSLVRNRAREGKARVPDVAIFATRKKLQPPTYAEGFDELFVVHARPEGEFEVQPATADEDSARV